MKAQSLVGATAALAIVYYKRLCRATSGALPPQSECGGR